jgi:hypothetical protein
MDVRMFRKMKWVNVIVALVFCLNFAFVNPALALRPGSGIKNAEVVAGLGGKDKEKAVELVNAANKLNIQPEILSNFKEVEQGITEPVIAPLQTYVDSINKLPSSTAPSVFGSYLPAGTIDVSDAQLTNFAGVLADYGLQPKGMKVTRLQGELDPNELLKVEGVAPIINISIAQAFGSVPFIGSGPQAKETMDANAVFFSDRSIRNEVDKDHNLAVGILGDEGCRDGSCSLTVFSIYYQGYAQESKSGKDVRKLFNNRAEFDQEIARLEKVGVKVSGGVGDALEVTNGAQDPKGLTSPTNSWSLFALFYNVLQNYNINDNGRVAGVSYNAPTDAGVDPFDLPSVALPKIAKARGIDIDNPVELANFMNHMAVFTLGPRELLKDYEKGATTHRHWKIFKDVQALQQRYPKLKLILTGDGDCAPRIIASLGLKLNFGGEEYLLTEFGRSGANEAHASLLVAQNVPGGQFANRYVSPTNTAADYLSENAVDFTEKEIKEFADQGIPQEVYRAKRTRDAIKGNGLVALTSVTGPDKNLFGDNFAKAIQRVKLNQDDKTGKATTSTFLVTPDGSVFVVTTQFEANDLSRNMAEIKSASPQASDYLGAIAEKKQAKQQFLKDLTGIIEVSSTEVKVLDRELFLKKGLDILAKAAALSKNPDVKAAARRVLLEVAPQFGIKLASDHEFYMAKQHGKWSNITVPAVNGRSTVYLSFKPLFRVAKEDNVGVVKTEVARSEQRYSAQDSYEIVAMSIAAAIKEGWTGLLFVQQDHNQIDKEKYLKGGADRQKEIDARNALFREGISAGQYDIDSDPSTLVDEQALAEVIKVEKELVDQYLETHSELLTNLKGDKQAEGSLRRMLVDEIEMRGDVDKDFLALPEVEAKIKRLEGELYPAMHKLTIEAALNDMREIRKLEKEYGLTKHVSIGIEERHIDNEKHRDYPSTVLGSITLSQSILKVAKAEDLVAHSKISLQTGTMHGIGGTVDFGIYQRHLKYRDRIGVAVFVLHGASTLEKRGFYQMRDGDVGEVHLATEYQKIVFGIIAEYYPELAEKMAVWLEKMMVSDKKLSKYKGLWDKAFAQGKDRKTVIAEILSDSSDMPKEFKGKFKDLVKELSAPFKNELWNLPEGVVQKIDQALYQEFKLIFSQLGVANTKDLIESIMPYNDYPVHLAARPAAMDAVFGKEKVQLELPIFNRGLIVDPGLLPAGGVTEILRIISRLKNQAIVFYGPGAEAMRVLSGESPNILIAANEAEAVKLLVEEKNLAPDSITLVTSTFKKEFETQGIKQKIVATDTMSVLLGLAKSALGINHSPATEQAFAALYSDLEKSGVIPNNENNAKILLESKLSVEEVKIESKVKPTEEQAAVMKDVAMKVGV